MGQQSQTAYRKTAGSNESRGKATVQPTTGSEWTVVKATGHGLLKRSSQALGRTPHALCMACWRQSITYTEHLHNQKHPFLIQDRFKLFFAIGL